MSAVDKVRVIVVGDSGVGKTSLLHLIANNESLTSPGWTIGCAVEVKLHEYKEGTPSQNTFFIELWDIGGSINHKNTRGVFYNPVHGIILVHDLTNRKSQENLQKWIIELLNKDGKDCSGSKDWDDFDPEEFFGSTQFDNLQIPILVIGTKADLVDDLDKFQRSGSIADRCCAEEIFLNSHQVTALAVGTTPAVKLSHFFDRVIERKYYSKESGLYGGDKRKFAMYT